MRKFCKELSLAFLDPNLSKEWDYKKNLPLSPKDVFAHSRFRAYWNCSKCGEKYLSPIDRRSNGHGCPYCSGRKVSKQNCLAAVNPHLKKEWHPTKNKLTPHDVTEHSVKKIYWLCRKCGQTWIATPNRRSNGIGCPYCSNQKVYRGNSLFYVSPKLSIEWHTTKNTTLNPKNIVARSQKKIWWKCQRCGEEYVARVYHRLIGMSGCPRCNGIKLKDGSICDSMVEAYYYLLLKKSRILFRHHVKIGLGRHICDFYIPSENKYIEVTGFGKSWLNWKKYRKVISKKRKYVIDVLGCKFEFIQAKLTSKQISYVQNNEI